VHISHISEKISVFDKSKISSYFMNLHINSCICKKKQQKTHLGVGPQMFGLTKSLCPQL